MAANTDIVAAVVVLVLDINGMPIAAPSPPQVFNPFASVNAFDLYSRSSSSAYVTVPTPLDDIWDGYTSTFPSFVTSLHLHAREGDWHAAGTTNATTGVITPNPTNIVDVADKNILTDYHLVTDAEITAASTACKNNRAIQNSKAMVGCIKYSIKGDIKDTIFTQFGSLLSVNDGIALFKHITTFTLVYYMQLSMLSLNKIVTFNPHDYEYNIPVINSKLNHYFVLSITSTHTFLSSENIQHLLIVYGKILQPETWTQ